MDNDQILVAIQCATYNHEPYIRQCLEGFVMQQTDFKFVAIVHDDASTDGTAAIVREFAEKYPDIIIPIYETENQYSKRDGSITRIINNAVNATGCKYIAICEGDDYWIDPLKLQKQVDYMELHTDCVMVHTNGFILDSKGRLQKNKNKINIEYTMHQLITNGNSISTPTTCIRKTAFDSYRDFINKTHFEPKIVGDFSHWLYYSTIGNIVLLPDYTTVYREVIGSASHQREWSKIKAYLDDGIAIPLFYNKYFNVGITEKVIKKRYYLSRTRIAAQFGRKEFLTEYKLLIKQYPKFLFNIRMWCVFIVRVFFNHSF